MPERFTETLRAASEAGWSHAVQHRFVNELFAGAVPDAVMARYLIHKAMLHSVRPTSFTRGAQGFGKAFGHDVGPRRTIRLSG